MSRALFDAIRRIKGSALTQEDVDAINAVLTAPVVVGNGSTIEEPISQTLVEQLKIDEGCRLIAYLDTEGVWTIGYGHTGPEVKRGLVWTQEQAEAALIKDIREHNAKLAAALPWLRKLDPVRQRVLQNMAFNLGIGSAETGKGLLGFKNTLAMIQAGRYAEAAENMLKSKWAGQVGQRAQRLSRRMKTGVE